MDLPSFYKKYRGTLFLRNTPPIGPCVVYAWGPRGVLGGWAISYGRGTPVDGPAEYFILAVIRSDVGLELNLRQSPRLLLT